MQQIRELAKEVLMEKPLYHKIEILLFLYVYASINFIIT